MFFRESKAVKYPDCRSVVSHHRLLDSEEPSGALDLFKELAGRAGAQLLLRIQKELTTQQNDPVTCWLACMWLYTPPVDERFGNRKLRPKSFRDEANTIERAGLCGSETPGDDSANQDSRGERKQGAEPGAPGTDSTTRPEVESARNLITAVVAVKRFNVSRATLQRAMTDEVLRSYRAIDAAERGPTILGGPDRGMAYRLATGTGFRRNELRNLAPESLDLDAAPPTVTVAACYSKRRRTIG